MNPTELQELRAKLRGDLVTPADAACEAGREGYDGTIDRRPALVARCADVADVMAGVNFARERKLRLAVRGGGPSGPGLGAYDGGLVIDLGRLRGIRVDTKRGAVRVEGGCLWGDVDHATHPFDLAVPGGLLSTAGVGGSTLRGGIGYLSRRHGLTIDNLLAVDVVLADGLLVTASAEENAELFWAVRGGGESIGVMTSFLFRARPVGTVYGGPIFWPMDRGADALRFWRDFILKAPEDMNGWFGFLTVPPLPMFPKEHHLKKMCVVSWCYTGDLGRAEPAFEPIRGFLPPVMDFAGPIPFPALQSLFDGLYPPGRRRYSKADFFPELSDKAVALHLKYGARLPGPHSTMHLCAIDGAAGRVGRGDTAFGFRDAKFAEVIFDADPDPGTNPRLTQWAKDYWLALHPFSVDGGHLDAAMDEGPDRVKAAHRENHARLAQVKRKYDPGSLFRASPDLGPV